MEIPMDRRIAESYSKGIPILVAHPSYVHKFKDLFERVEKLLVNPYEWSSLTDSFNE
jgi:hypothetical protein